MEIKIEWIPAALGGVLVPIVTVLEQPEEGAIEQLFPVHRNSRPEHSPEFVPMSVLSEEWAEKNHGQSLQKLCNRGGMSVVEIAMNVMGRAFKEKNVIAESPALLLVKELGRLIKD